MHCPTLAELPPPPPGKVGWPWTVESPRVPDTMPDGSAWPRMSIVTPSYNQGQFIEETIRSILLQGYPDVECIVIDGGSTDDTCVVLRKYEKHLTFWASEKDRGQSHAINKGLRRVSGDVWMYQNSDDLLTPGALAAVARRFADPSVSWVGGSSDNFGIGAPAGGVVPAPVISAKDYLCPWSRTPRYVFPFSGASYMRRALLDRLGVFDESFHYSMDIEYYCRAIFEGGYRLTLIPEVLASWRWHGLSKTMGQGIAYAFRADEVRIARRYLGFLSENEREQVEAEIRDQERLLPSREAMWRLGEGDRKGALSLLAKTGLRDWSLIASRPWLGAVRRAISR
jgi:glycosyltransferase involved in cell wall biosynthesis